MVNSIELRRKQYFQLSSQIAQLNDVQLRSWLDTVESDEPSTVLGSHHTIALGQSNIFVKRIPITTLEHANLFSTKNLYNLPTAYNYGFGSTGLGVFRELISS